MKCFFNKFFKQCSAYYRQSKFSSIQVLLFSYLLLYSKLTSYNNINFCGAVRLCWPNQNICLQYTHSEINTSKAHTQPHKSPCPTVTQSFLWPFSLGPFGGSRLLITRVCFAESPEESPQMMYLSCDVVCKQLRTIVCVCVSANLCVRQVDCGWSRAECATWRTRRTGDARQESGCISEMCALNVNRCVRGLKARTTRTHPQNARSRILLR